MPYDRSKHHRRSIRLAAYDYSAPSAYFVTICVRGGACLLGEVRGQNGTDFDKSPCLVYPSRTVCPRMVFGG